MTLLARLVDALAATAADARLDAVHTVVLADPDYGDCLVELADLLGEDPAQASTIAALLAAAADERRLPGAAAQARYLQAQGLVGVGDLVGALQLIDAAERGFQATDRLGAALRTNLGRSHVLNEMGRHDDALAAADAIVTTLARRPPVDLDPTEREVLLAYAQQNRGLCCELTSRYAEALDAYAAAESVYRRLGDTALIGEVAHDRGLVLMAIGRIGEALGAFRFAADTFAEAGQVANHANALTGLAEAQLFSAMYRQCLDTLGDCRDLLAAIDVPVRDHDRMLVAARAYEALNLYPEARSAYREVVEFFVASGMVVDEALARWGLGRVERGLGRRRAAEQELVAAAATFESSDHRHWLAGVLLDRSYVACDAGRVDDALVLAEQAVIIADAADATIEQVRSRLAAVRCLDLLARDGEASAVFDTARSLAAAIGFAPLDLLLDQVEGVRAVTKGPASRARELLGRVADEFEWTRSALGHDAFGASFMADKTEVFDALVTTELATATGDRAWASRVLSAIERCRSRALAELVAGRVTARREAGPSESTIALQHELDAVYNEMLLPGAVGVDQAARLLERSGDIEQRLGRLRLDEASPLGHTEPAVGPTDTIQTRVPKVPVLSWFCLGDEVIAMVIDGDHLHVRRHVAAVGELADLVARLDAQWDRLHLDAELVARHVGRLTRSCCRVLAQLYDRLIRPVADVLPAPEPSGQPLTIIAHGVLHRVPVHALFDGERHMIEGYEVTYSPSLSDVAERESMAARITGRSLVMGIPDESAPGIADEVKAVAAHLANVNLYCGAGATAAVLAAHSGQAEVIHLACHALFRNDNPMFSSLRLADRWLAAHELLELDLRGSVTVMSACDSGRTSAIGGDELLGLTRAVLGAGARTLVAALWPAHDQATVELMGTFYTELAGRGPATALRTAQMAQLKLRSHPYHWAPFVVIGGR